MAGAALLAWSCAPMSVGPDPGDPLRSTPFGPTTRGLYGAESIVMVDNGSLLGNTAALLLKQDGFDVKFLEEPAPTANDIMLSGARFDGRPEPAKPPFTDVLKVIADLSGPGPQAPRTKDSLFVTMRAVPGGYAVFCNLGTETRDPGGQLKSSAPSPGYDSYTFARRLALACNAPPPKAPPTPAPQPSVMEQIFGDLKPRPRLPRTRLRPEPLPTPTPDHRRSNMLFGPQH